jgi:hypothetical protein
VSLFRRTETTGDAAEILPANTTTREDPISAALEHFAGLSVSERAAEVLAEVGPRIAAAWDEVDWRGWEPPKGTDMHTLLEPLVPRFRAKDLTAEQRMKLASLRVTLAEAFQALVLSRMLIRQDPSGGTYSEAAYANSPDGLAALERGDVGAVVARRLPA